MGSSTRPPSMNRTSSFGLDFHEITRTSIDCYNECERSALNEREPDPQLEAMIRAKVESGMYNNASEVVREALRIMEREERNNGSGKSWT